MNIMAIDHLNYSATVRHLPGTKLARAYEHIGSSTAKGWDQKRSIGTRPRSTQTNRKHRASW